MTQNLKALVLTYKTAPVAVREQVSLTESAVKQLLNFIRDYTATTDVLVVSTCNRTEIYYVAEQDYASEIFKGLSLVKNIDSGFEQHFTTLTGTDAVNHLFEVAIGLDAQVPAALPRLLGHPALARDIPGIVTEAWEEASVAPAWGELHRLLPAHALASVPGVTAPGSDLDVPLSGDGETVRCTGSTPTPVTPSAATGSTPSVSSTPP